MSEDWLYLNIWTPPTSPEDKRAVMVYFHGGVGTSGEGSEAIFDSSMAKKGVIWVTANRGGGSVSTLGLGFFGRRVTIELV